MNAVQLPAILRVVGQFIAVVLIGGLLLVVVWTLGSYLWRAVAVRRRRREALSRRVDEHGRLLPPVSRGLCHRCQRVSSIVYHLPSGEGLCENCYQPDDACPDP